MTRKPWRKHEFSFRHPAAELPAPERLYRQVVIFGLVFLFLTSLNLRGLAYASAVGMEGGVSLEELDHLTLTHEDVIAVSDGDGFLLKTAPYGSSICDQTRSGKAYYEVEYGDTLSGIATCYNVNVSSLIYANPDLSNGSYLTVGQTLTIPEADGIYVSLEDSDVKASDLQALIEEHNGNYDETLAYYEWTPETSVPNGTEFLIIDGSPPPPPEPEPVIVADTSSPTVEVTYPQGEVSSAPAASPGTVSGSGFMWPVEGNQGIVTCGYLCYTGHYAMDIASNALPSVTASMSGTVSFAGWNGPYGYCVIIDHGGGVQTLYAHNNQLYVSAGEYVYQGQAIAQMGSTGNSSGPHVHFEIIMSGVKQNPEYYVWR